MLWEKIRNKWDFFWIGDEYDDSKKHLSQSDKRFLLYGNFIIGVFTIVLVLLIIGFNNLRLNRQNVADMELVINMTKSYIGSATEDEYDRIAQTIRHDLMFSDYGEGMQKYAQHIPNSTEECHACKGDNMAQVALVSLNTGESYGLDLFGQETELEDSHGSIQVAFGYDEISQANIRMIKDPGRDEGTAEIERGNGMVSLHKMKELFCDNCIGNILKVIEGQEMEEFVLHDVEKNIFYPIKDGCEMQIGNYILKVGYQDGDCEIEIKPVGREQ